MAFAPFLAHVIVFLTIYFILERSMLYWFVFMPYENCKDDFQFRDALISTRDILCSK